MLNQELADSRSPFSVPRPVSTDFEGVYIPRSRPGGFESTPLANAGWYAEGQHGGALAALLVGVAETIPTLTEMEIARATIEIFRVVPLVPLQVETEVVREGKRLQTVKLEVRGPDETLLSMALVQRLRVADRPLPGEAATDTNPHPAPDDSARTDPRSWGIGEADKTMFHRDAIEIREIHGGFGTIGHGAIWVRPRMPIIAGRPVSAAQRAVIAADFCNGVSRRLPLGDWVFMNSDLTIHIGRYPEGEWVALDARSSYSSRGRGVAAGLLWDQTRWVGRSAQTLFLDRTEQV